MSLSRLGMVVRNQRLELGLSQMELADAAGIHRTYLSDVESGERNISIKMLLKLAGALNIEASKLVGQAEEGSMSDLDQLPGRLPRRLLMTERFCRLNQKSKNACNHSLQGL